MQSDEIRVVVLPGNVIYRGEQKIGPGEELDIAETELMRLSGIVEPVEGPGQGGETNPLVDAIENLDPDKNNELVWTKSGKPQVSALAEIVGHAVSAKERDQAWEEFCNP